MKVLPITKTHINFGKVGFSEEPSKFTDSEYKMAQNIINKMQTPSDNYDGKTAEKYYEKLGYDFGIYTGKQRNTIDIVGWQERKTGYREFFVGQYDAGHRFDISDIETGIKNNEEAIKEDNIWLNRFAQQIFLGMLFVFGAFGLSAFIISKYGHKEAEKPLIQVVDTLSAKKGMVGFNLPNLNGGL